MSAGALIGKRLESEITRVPMIGHIRDRPEGHNEADTKAAFIGSILSATYARSAGVDRASLTNGDGGCMVLNLCHGFAGWRGEQL